MAARATLLIAITSLGILFWPSATRQFRVVGSSMAETLLGPHRRCECPQCGYPLRYFADGMPTHPSLVCPNCDHRYRETNAIDLPGDVVTCTAQSPAAAPVRRWQIVVAQIGDQRVIKRVIGLPNEKITMRYGDIYVDGELERKPWDTFRALAIPVHLDRYQPKDARRGKWTLDGEIERRAATGRYVVGPSSTRPIGGPPGDRETPDADRFSRPARGTLRFHPHGVSSDGPHPKTARILDPYGSNQFRSLRLVPVADFVIHLRLRHFSAANMTITLDGVQVSLSLAASGKNRCDIFEMLPSRVTLRDSTVTRVLTAKPDPDPRELADSNRAPTAVLASRRRATVPFRRPRGAWWDLWCGYLDGMFVVLLDGERLAELRIDREARVRRGATDVQLAMETIGRLEFEPPSLWRDIHYRMSPLEEGTGNWSLGPNDYLLLGDQPSVSRDARQASAEGIASRESIEAVVLGHTRGT